MAYEDKDKKTRLNGMLSQSSGATVGKSTAVDDGNESDESTETAGTDQAAPEEPLAGDHEHAGDAPAAARTAPAAAPVATHTATKPEPDAHAAPAGPAPGATTHVGADARREKAEGGDATAAPGAPPAAGAAPATAKPGKAGALKTTGEHGKPASTAAIPKIAVGEKVTVTAPEEGIFSIDGSEIARGESFTWDGSKTAAAKNIKWEPYLTSSLKGQSSSVPVLVVAPNKVSFKKVGDVPATGPGMAGVGMTLKVTVGPDDVSFGDAVEWLEKPGPAEGVSGYFAAYVATGQSLAHPPNPNWLPIGANNDSIQDNAWTRDKPQLNKDGKAQWWAGSFGWTIPNAYRVKGGPEVVFDSVKQSFTMADDGSITVTKGAASATAKPDNKIEGAIQTFKNVQEATVFLQPHGRAGCVQAIMNYRRSPNADEASVKLLVQALKTFDVTFRVVVECSGVFAWTDSTDKTTVKANGQASDEDHRNIKKGSGADFNFRVNKILDLNTIGTTPINIATTNEDVTSPHAASASVTYPYSGSGTLNENYTYKTFFC